MGLKKNETIDLLIFSLSQLNCKTTDVDNYGQIFFVQGEVWIDPPPPLHIYRYSTGVKNITALLKCFWFGLVRYFVFGMTLNNSRISCNVQQKQKTWEIYWLSTKKNTVGIWVSIAKANSNRIMKVWLFFYNSVKTPSDLAK